mmetsp:Transcript_91100/g.260144  ORF Transcript_91100/g.260144 Transcript_91100/m.260144 type:complete len:291 (+) Transcript_91100:60-932(+)
MVYTIVVLRLRGLLGFCRGWRYVRAQVEVMHKASCAYLARPAFLLELDVVMCFGIDHGDSDEHVVEINRKPPLHHVWFNNHGEDRELQVGHQHLLFAFRRRWRSCVGDARVQERARRETRVPKRAGVRLQHAFLGPVGEAPVDRSHVCHEGRVHLEHEPDRRMVLQLVTNVRQLNHRLAQAHVQQVLTPPDPGLHKQGRRVDCTGRQNDAGLWVDGLSPRPPLPIHAAHLVHADDRLTVLANCGLQPKVLNQREHAQREPVGIGRQRGCQQRSGRTVAHLGVRGCGARGA